MEVICTRNLTFGDQNMFCELNFFDETSEAQLIDFYKNNKIDSEHYTIALFLENCLEEPIGVPQEYDNFPIKEICKRLLKEGNELLQKKGFLRSSYIHDILIMSRDGCINVSEEKQVIRNCLSRYGLIDLSSQN